MCYLSVYVLFKFSYKFKDDFIRDLTTKFRNILADWTSNSKRFHNKQPAFGKVLEN
jgi:hypothetical protein